MNRKRLEQERRQESASLQNGAESVILNTYYHKIKRTEYSIIREKK